MKAPARPAALLFAASLTLRLLVFLAVTWADVPLLFDEAGYFDRAAAWRQIAVGGGDLAGDLTRVYGRGHWPPLHPLVLAAGMVVGGPQVWAARLVMVLVSALTTPLVFRLTQATAGRRAAWWAAGIHLFYPTFVAYSHYLWSETTAIFLLLGAALVAVGAAADEDDRRALLRAAAAGALLGLAVLVRAASLPFLPVVAGWLYLVSRRRRRRRRCRLAAAAAALAAGLVVLAPWQAVVTAQAGRPALLSTLGGFNLALGNNPWVPAGLGSSWGHPPSKVRLRAALDETARRRGTDWEAAGYPLAWQEILRRPGRSLVRVCERLRMLWAPDFFPLRHLFHAAYPPLPPVVAGLLALATTAAYLALMTLSIVGLLGAPRASAGLALTGALVAAGMVLPALTFGMSRLHLPLLALLLPAAGRGAVHLLSPRRRQLKGAAVVVWLLFVAAFAGSLPRVVSLHLLPSSHYAAVLTAVARPLGASPSFADRIVLRRRAGVGGELRITTLGSGVRLAVGSRQRRWPEGSARLRLVLRSHGSPEIELTASDPAAAVRLRPIGPESWRRWRPTGLRGVDFLWLGGAG